jgi:hypothetical protein
MARDHDGSQPRRNSARATSADLRRISDDVQESQKDLARFGNKLQKLKDTLDRQQKKRSR